MVQTTRQDLLTEITNAEQHVYKMNGPTPLELVELNGLPVYMKREDLSAVRSYKWRGAFNLMAQLSDEQKQRPVITASAGNHAQGVAQAARILGLQANIYMPVTTPRVKQNAVRKHGGDAVNIILTGDTYNQAADAAKKMAHETRQFYVPAFDNLYTVAGQGTMATEIVRETPADQPFTLAFLQIGGGGMAAGVSAVLRAAYPGIRIIGVEGQDQASMKASFDAGRLSTLDSIDAFCDGTAVTRPGDLCYRICRENLDEIITVSNADVSATMGSMWTDAHIISEPSGAMGVAGLQRYARENPDAVLNQKILTIISGANVDADKLGQIFTNASAGAQNRKRLRFEIGEERGSLLDLIETHFADVNISAFQYGKIDSNRAWPVIAFDADNATMESITARLDKAKVIYKDVTNQSDANKQLVIYDPHLFNNPIFLHVGFPERKGALREFLRVAQPAATNICYFNYAYSGDLVGDALLGFEFADASMQQNFMNLVNELPTTVRPVEDSLRRQMLYNIPQNLGL